MNSFVNKLITLSFLAVVMVSFFAIFNVDVMAGKTPAFPTDPCATASDSPFCKDALDNPRGGDPIDNDSSPILGPSSVFYKVTQTVTLITGAVSIIMMMVGGFRYIVSGGDSTAIKAAKDTMLYALVGLIVAIFAQTIITFVLSNI